MKKIIAAVAALIALTGCGSSGQYSSGYEDAPYATTVTLPDGRLVDCVVGRGMYAYAIDCDWNNVR